MHTEEQSLALKVMRLYKPRLREPGIGLGMCSFDPQSWTHGQSGTLILPGSFAKIYIGQVFSCYICVSNNGLFPEVKNLAIKAELEAGNSKIFLQDRREKKDNSKAYGKLDISRKGDAVDFVIEHELVSVGTHTLRVSVEFDSMQPPNSRRSVRKHYKFLVEEPLGYSCTFTKIANEIFTNKNGVQRLLCQAKITNKTDEDLLLQTVEMQPESDMFQALHVNNNHNNKGQSLLALQKEKHMDDDSSISDPVLLKPNAARSFLFILEPKPTHPHAILPSGVKFAKLLTRWRTDFAESGRLVLHPLSWKLPSDQVVDTPLNLSKVSIFISHPKNRLKVGTPTDLLIQVTNTCNLDVDLQLEIDSSKASSPLLVMGTVNVHLGLLKPNQKFERSISIVPLCQGLLPLPFISVKDFFSNETFQPDKENTKLYVTN